MCDHNSPPIRLGFMLIYQKCILVHTKGISSNSTIEVGIRDQMKFNTQELALNFDPKDGKQT